jgi:hypothetical protein
VRSAGNGDIGVAAGVFWLLRVNCIFVQFLVVLWRRLSLCCEVA